MDRPPLWGCGDLPMARRRFASWGDAVLAALSAEAITPAEAAHFVSMLYADYQDRVADIPLMKRRIERLQVKQL